MPRRTSHEGMIAIVCPCCKTVFFQYDLSQRSPERYLGSPYPRRVMSQYDAKIEPDGTFRCPVCGAVLNIKKLKILIYKYKDFASNIGFVRKSSDGRRVLSLLTETDVIAYKALSKELRSRLRAVMEAHEALGNAGVNSTSLPVKAEESIAGTLG